MRSYYVALTGSRGNSGDDLIMNSALKLFREFRPDRDIVTVNAWEKFDSERLRLVNGAKALILLGGPALRFDTYPGVYPLTDNLSSITVPIIMLGVGYRDQDGSWSNTSRFFLSEKTRLLLARINESGYMSGVRDFHTLNVLISNRYRNFSMVGCPAMYNTDYIGRPFKVREISKIAFAPGRMYLRSRSLFDQQLQVVLDIKKANPGREFTVAFHDPINLKNEQTRTFVDHLVRNSIPFEDISGDADNLMNFYLQQDLQIGYRVHAHIFMCSVNRLSVLINEDGRGKGMKTVLDGLIFDAYRLAGLNILDRLGIKVGLRNPNDFVLAERSLSGDLINNLLYEEENAFPRISRARSNIDLYFSAFKNIIQKLP